MECPNCDNSGVAVYEYGRGPEPEQCQFCYEHPGSVFQIEALIARVREDEREACAKACDELQEDMADADKCAAAIRARHVE